MDLPFDLSRWENLVSEFIARPRGSEWLSSVDDAIRETRAHLVECMQKISGYPNVDTVAVKVWDNSTKPRGFSNDENRLLLGYNTDINALEVITKQGAAVNAVALLAYPVGSYYETSDASFNPNTAWGGTWEQDSNGRVMVAAGKKTRRVQAQENQYIEQEIAGSYEFSTSENNWDQSAGRGGEETHYLARPELPARQDVTVNNVQSEMPIHYHPHRHPHSHYVNGSLIREAGTGDTPYYVAYETSQPASGNYLSVVADDQVKTDLPKKEDYAYSMGENNGSEIGWFPLSDHDYTLHGMVDADTLKDTEYDPETHEPTRTISEDLIMHVGSKIGENGHNNLQPYKVCYRWHRTA